jgi:hypothetical protein
MNKLGLHKDVIAITVLDRKYNYKMEFRSFKSFRKYFSLGNHLYNDISEQLRKGEIILVGGQIICSTEKYKSKQTKLGKTLKTKESNRLKKIKNYLKARDRRVVVLDMNYNVIEHFPKGTSLFAQKYNIDESTAGRVCSRAKNRLLSTRVKKEVLFKDGYTYLLAKDYREIKNKLGK